jgi:ParB-like chromosome segregation protein Spo0J
MKRPDLLIEQTPIASLKLNPNNPRRHSDRQIKQIACSIEAFGFNVPVLVDRSGQVLAGHGRLLPARSSVEQLCRPSGSTI